MDLENQLPYAVREKLRYYLDFVHDRLHEVAHIENKGELARSVRKEVDLVFLLRLLYGYFVVGYRNYAGVLHYFDSQEVDGFRIGTTDFTISSQITLEWRQLATDLETLLADGRIAQYVRPTMSTDEVIRRILQSRSRSETDQGPSDE
jgi:hypothetical protein